MASFSEPLLQVALLSQPFATLTYGVPEELGEDAFPPGSRVLAPMGRSIRTGVVLGPCGPAQRERIPEKVRIKPLLWPLDHGGAGRNGALISPLLLGTALALAGRQALPVGKVLAAILPAGFRSTDIRFQVYGQGEPRTMLPPDIARADRKCRRELADAWRKGDMRVLLRPGDARDEECVSLAMDPPWPVRPAAKRQQAVLEALWEKGGMSRRELTDTLGAGVSQVVKTLAANGLVSIGPMGDPFSALACDEAGENSGGSFREIIPTEEQRTGLDRLHAMLAGDGFACALVHGVTGSGKTYCYLELIRDCLAQGRSAYLLAPEVALACQLHANVRSYLAEYREGLPQGAEAIFHHGYQSRAQREEHFARLGSDDTPRVIVGTRSALFLPAFDPGLVILDEEHDGSFKQDERMVYQAKEVAFHMMSEANGVLVLGSATPDVKSFHAARSGQVELVTFASRVGAGTLPDITVVDIRDIGATDHLLADESMERLRETLDRGQQAVIMLNRRGYSPLMYCVDCGTSMACPECDIGLTYHKRLERLVCHYCGLNLHFPVTCAKCGGDNFLPMGEGTEKIEETLSAVLPHGVKALRLDRDTTRRPGRVEEILAAFGRGEAQVLVGTQMLSKGHHFPRVTLAIAADADLGLNLPDFRATERSFQLLVQMAGRAGRGEEPGKVLIQTRDPGNPCWRFVRENDYLGFYESEIEKRSRMSYPPFVKLALVRMDYPMDWDQGFDLARNIANGARQQGMARGVFLLGPAPAPLGLLRGRRRVHCLLKGKDWNSIRAVYSVMARNVPQRSGLRISLDLDPVDML